MNQALLSFSLGPVQEFIAAARTTRDLWTGSWLLSWLTAHAIHEVLTHEEAAEVLFPHVWSKDKQERVPLLAAVAAVQQGRDNDIPASSLLACLPNAFVASLPREQAETVTDSCRRAVETEWMRIANKVHERLKDAWRMDDPWDYRWREQITEFWDIRVSLLPGDVEEDRLRRMLADRRADAFQLRMQSLGKLAAAQKQIRHFPSHELAEYIVGNHADSFEPRDDTRPKCSQLGSQAQMGPIATGTQSQMTISSDFWKQVQHINVDGTQLGKRDRMCAVSLVKRFAWSVVLADTLHQQREARHFSDIDTICAAEWLHSLDRDPRFQALQWNARHRTQPWSGHWLRWEAIEEAEEEGEIEPDPETIEKIKRARNRDFAGPPPTYYAVIQLDGDNMGAIFRKLDKQGLQEVSEQLAEFAGDSVPRIVREQFGSLVYAGGDDVLAFVPAGRALECAARLNEAFRALSFPDLSPRSSSAAVVVAHYKTPLRLVLASAREAESQAKLSGRDCLAVRVMKRSGEQATAVVGWEQVAALEQFVADFRAGASDRWAYRFRQQLDDLPLVQMWPAELKRLLGRAEALPKDFDQRVLCFWKNYQCWCEGRRELSPPNQRPLWPLSFVHLIQAASFLARGGKE